MKIKMFVNPDINYVQGIINGLIKKNGHCPCQIQSNDDTLCPCIHYREEQKCCCKLYLNVEEYLKTLINWRDKNE